MAVVLIAALMLTPEMANTDVDQRVTTHSTNPSGASGIYEIASRLGWRVKRQETPFVAPLDTSAVYAVLAPVEPLGDAEAHIILDAVRRGAGLIIVADSGEVLSDSLHLKHRGPAGRVLVDAGDTAGCGAHPAPIVLAFIVRDMNYLASSGGPPLPDDTLTFIAVRAAGGRRRRTPVRAFNDSVTAIDDELTGRNRAAESLPVAAVLGIPVGRGRVVAVGDPDFLRNDEIRICGRDVGPRMINALDWASRGRRPPLIFDEYHQGFGERPSVFQASRHFLASTPLGHTILQALLAGTLLIIALGVRPIPPRGVPRIERRSPLEHVDALARAYDQVEATRTATRRLVRGLRRRHDRGSLSARVRAAGPPSSDADQRFLDNVAAAHPEVRPAVTTILAAERTAHPETDLVTVADAVDRIDDVFPSRDIPSDSPPSLKH